MDKPITIAALIEVIKRLPADDPEINPRVWYKTQKEHWLGWLGGYDGPGVYRRKNWDRDARFAYNHVVCPGLLLYLIRAIPLQPETIIAAEDAERGAITLMAKAGAIRKVVPWEMIYLALWRRRRKTLLNKLGIYKDR